MKRFVLYMLLVMLLVGCVADELNGKDDGTNNYQPQYITATVAVDGLLGTRGTPINYASEMTDFGFFSSYTGLDKWVDSNEPNKMYNQKMVRNTTTGFWEYAGTAVEWDNTTAADNYTFFAYAPFATSANGITVTSSATTKGIPTLSYKVPTTVQDQPDLMLAVPRKDIHPTGHPVALQMRHALTAIGFMVYGDGTVTGLSVTGVHDSGNLSMDGSNIAWTITSGSVSALDFSASLDGGAYTVHSATPENLLTDDGYLMMIPQTLTDDAKVKVTYEGITQELDLKEATPEWEAGKRIIYSIKIGEGEIVLSTIAITPDYILLDHNAHTPAAEEMTVTATKGDGSPDPTATWTLAADQPWITFTLNSDGSGATATLSSTGTKKVYLVVEANTGTDIRVADLSLNGIIHSAIVIQKYYSPLTISVTPQYVQLSYMAQTPSDQTVYVSAMRGEDPDPYAKWTLTSPAPWLTLSLNADGSGAMPTVEGTGSQTVYLIVPVNNTGAIRLTELFLNGTDPVVTVRQSISTEAITNVAPSALEVAHYGQTPTPETLSVTTTQGGLPVTDVNWTLTSNQSWLYLSLSSTGSPAALTVSGKGSQTVYLVTGKNAGNAPRVAGVYLNGNASNIVSTVTQKHLNALGETGSSFERIYIDPNDGDPKLLLTKNPNNAGAMFQFGGIRGWSHKTSGSAGNANYNPSTLSSAWNSSWQPTTVSNYTVPHDVANLRNGIGDPCRLVGYTQAEIKAAIATTNPNAYAPDNLTWRLPTGTQLYGYQSVSGGSNKETFPRHGRISELGSFQNFDTGFYWSSWKTGGGTPSGNNAGFLQVSSSSKFLNGGFQAFGMSIRCVTQ